MYVIAEAYKTLPPHKLVTIMEGEQPFTLDAKPYVVDVPASKEGPARSVTIPPATQAQLKKLHDGGHTGKKGPMIVVAEAKKSGSNS